MNFADKVLVADELVRLYRNGVTSVSTISRSFPMARSTLQGYLDCLPPDMDRGENSLQVRRAANRMVGIDESNVTYTIHEKVEAFVAAIHGKSYDEIREKFGVPKGTVFRMMTKAKDALNLERNRENATPLQDLKELRTLLQAKSEVLVEDLAWEIAEEARVGRKPLLSDTEIALHAELFSCMTNGGIHCSARRIQAVCQNQLKRKAEEVVDYLDTDDHKTQRLVQSLTNAKMGRKWVRENFQKRTKSLKVADDNKKLFVKTKTMDVKRAAASNPVFTSLMIRKIKDMYKRHFEAGILKTELPEADQVFNGDEIGLDPFTKHGPSYSLTGSSCHNTTIGYEKSPFWVSMFFFTRADGDLSIPPMVVHQSECTERIAEGFVHGLDPTWLVSSTSSGYFDQSCFQHLAAKFVEHCGATAEKPVYLFLDGHDSHWEPESLRYLLSKNVHVFFLKANGSANDQPNDMGPNSAYKSCLRKYVEDWSLRYLGLPFKPNIMNALATAAWKEFVGSEETKPKIQRAFRSANLHPLLDPLEGMVLCEHDGEADQEAAYVEAHNMDNVMDEEDSYGDDDVNKIGGLNGIDDHNENTVGDESANNSGDDSDSYNYNDSEDFQTKWRHKRQQWLTAASDDEHSEDFTGDDKDCSSNLMRASSSSAGCSSSSQLATLRQSSSAEGTQVVVSAPTFVQRPKGRHETQFHEILDVTESGRNLNHAVASIQRQNDEIQLDHAGFETQPDGITDIKIRAISQSRHPEEWRLAVKYLGHCMFHERIVAPAQEVQDIIRSQQSMKGNSAPKSAALGTTKTATGMQVTERLANQIEEQKAQKAQGVSAKLQRKKEKEEKTKEQVPLNRAAAMDILNMFKNGQDWKKQTVPVLRAAYEHFTSRKSPPKSSSGASVTKMDFIDALTPILISETAPASAH